MARVIRIASLSCCVVPVSFAALLLAGCNSNGRGTGKVSGQVLIDGTPLRGGTIMLIPTAAGTASAGGPIDESGHYGPLDVPEGEVLVSVDNRGLAPRPPAGPITLPKNLKPEARAKIMESRAHAAPASPPNPNYMPIPSRYYLAETSGLTFKVERGDQKHDFELKSK